jgi:hypothetical protein
MIYLVKMFKLCSDNVQTLFRLFRRCSECSKSVQNFQTMFRMFKICSECSFFSDMSRLCSECSEMFRQCSESVQNFQPMFRMFRHCSDCSDNVQTLFSPCSESVQNFQSMFRMFRICSEFSVNVQNVQNFQSMFRICLDFFWILAQKLIYSEFHDFVVSGNVYMRCFWYNRYQVGWGVSGITVTRYDEVFLV